MADNNENKVLNVPHLRFPEFSGEWETKSINDLADVIGGGTPDTTVKSYWDGGIQWFTPSEIGKNKFVDASLRTITEDGLNNSSAKLLPPNTILLSSRATIGECSLSLRECATNQGFQSLVSKKCNVDFLYYLIQTKKKDLIRKSCGSTFLEISANEVRKIQVSVPSDVEQQKIAGLLSLIDKRIATQNKIIEKLESLIKGIADKLFQTARETKLLLELAPNITSGTDKNGSGTIPLYGSTGIIGKVKNASQKGNIVLVARVGTIGTVQYVKEPCGVSDNALIVEAGEMTKYIYHFLKTYKFAHITSGTTQPLITASSLKKIAVPTYDIERQTQIVLCLNILERKLDIEKQYLSDIAMMKQYLLHQMFI